MKIVGIRDGTEMIFQYFQTQRRGERQILKALWNQ